jgi:RimJ/RimL family protein N-acetyltransferase
MLSAAFLGDEDQPRQMLEQTRSFLEAYPRPDPWGSYLAWDGSLAVGMCAFKSAPDASGAVEIAYNTFPAHEGRGYARGMIRSLVDLAVRAGGSTVFAHTLAEENSSNGALKREGFSFAGEMLDPEDGPVWRWERLA